MRFRLLATILIIGPTVLGVASAQEPLLDAGRQAMIMHQGDLLEQQTAPNNRDRAVPKRVTRAATMDCSMAQARERLRPEHERRVRLYGREAANAWLRREGEALGRQAGARARAGKQC